MIVSSFQAVGPVLVVFSTNDVIWERVVRWFTKSPVSHAALAVRRADGWAVIEMKDAGFQVVPLAEWSKHNRLVAAFATRHAADAQLAALNTLTPFREAEYDHSGFYLWPITQRREVSTEKLICTELVAIYLRALGLDVDPARGHTPDEALAWLLRHPLAERVG